MARVMQQRALRTRRAILKAARIEFSAKGFHGARVDVIAAKAHINKQRLYAYFGSKAGLFKEVLAECFRSMAGEERHLLKLTEADLPHLRQLILERYVTIHADNPDVWRLLAWENLEGGRHSAALCGIKDPVFRHLRELYAAGQENGQFHRQVPFESFIFPLLAVSYFLFSNRHTLKRTLGLDTTRAAVRQSVCDAVVRDWENVGRIYLVGGSMGGSSALTFAALQYHTRQRKRP